MRIHNLTLEGFRSYQKAELSIDPHRRTLFHGPNGAGKTNILEALSFLSAGKSCLRVPSEEALKWGETFFRLRAELMTDAGEKKNVEYVFQISPRRKTAVFLNDLKTPITEFIGALPTIVFLPEHLDLFTGPPNGRRSFLDALLAQLFSGFAGMRLEYDKILRQRNAELKRIHAGEGSEESLDLWDKTLVAAAMPILSKRRKILQELSTMLPNWLQHFGEDWEGVSLLYNSKCGETEEECLRELRRVRERDVLLETTSVGPHRDDWQVVADHHALETFASRGQQRTTLLALLVSSADLFTTYRHEEPILLFDDVFSELDRTHQEALVESLGNRQIIMTSTHDVDPHSSLSQRLVESGSVREEALV